MEFLSSLIDYLPAWVKLEYLLALIFFLFSIVSLNFPSVITKLLMKFFLKDEKLTKGEKLFIKLSVWISYFLALLFLNLSIVQLPVPSKFLLVINKIFFILYVGIISFISVKILDIVLEKFSSSMKRKVLPSEAPLVETYYSMISKLVKIFVFIIGLIAILDKFGFNVTSLVTSLGVGSLAVGLAAQDTIKNFISGVLLVTDRQFRIGDRVYIKDIDIEGYVYDIGLRTTKILTITGNNLITIPNSKLTEGIIENSLYPDPRVKDFVEIGVAYGSDVELVKKLLLRATEEIEGIVENPPPSVYFTQFGDSALVFKLIYYVEKKDIAFEVKSILHQKIDKLFKENNIEIPFPQNDVWFRNPLKVEVKNEETLQRKDEKL
ncbi:MscS Mechanosensitive ion channel [Desulfurobacterium thermolithotrophum DSM 11699]|uniref:MscS Mechanosensitive ion channel n=1 Tax=Desulfurobacterium thermolithotrophum (strain DSM 11699 / BSA) TaxID=868864 RepID=F0S3F5_DESTD|nr:mechanosensitive ion channel family protein [Desulfurobacterium thermolithotrophum]ADY73377.1 MscS Mechanosensitive ion channel [Desulfurobacterium thermolithotrophum DSM 11699]